MCVREKGVALGGQERELNKKKKDERIICHLTIKKQTPKCLRYNVIISSKPVQG